MPIKNDKVDHPKQAIILKTEQVRSRAKTVEKIDNKREAVMEKMTQI